MPIPIGPPDSDIHPYYNRYSDNCPHGTREIDALPDGTRDSGIPAVSGPLSLR